MFEDGHDIMPENRQTHTQMLDCFVLGEEGGIVYLLASSVDDKTFEAQDDQHVEHGEGNDGRHPLLVA